MSSKKIKHKNEKKANWHKAASRHHIGIVPPSHAFKGKGSGGGGAKKVDLTNITLNGTPLDELVVTDEELETKKISPDSSLRLHPYVPSKRTYKQKYSGRTGEAVNPYSEEVLAHYQFLVVAKGEKEASAYLNSLKGVIMNEQVSNATLVQAATIGPIEKALKEAEEKVTFFRKQAITAQQEEVRWVEVVRSLQEALALSTGKKKPEVRTETANAEQRPSSGPGSRIYRDWLSILTKAMQDRPDGMSKNELKHAIMAIDPSAKENNAYGGIHVGERNSFIIEVDGKYYLQAHYENNKSETA